MESPEDFHHPFHPYQIQKDFMRGLYSTLESKCVGIFESPTGTVYMLILDNIDVLGEKSEPDLWCANLASGPQTVGS